MRRMFSISCLIFIFPGCFLWGAKPGVLVDKGQITKRAVFKPSIPAAVKRIQIGDFDRSGGNEIAVLGENGISLLSCKDYHLIKTYEFSKIDWKKSRLGLRPALVNINADEKFAIMRGGGGFGDVGLLNSKGQPLWIFEARPGHPTKRMIQADLNKDNDIEFYAADSSGLYRLDKNGAIKQKISSKSTSDINTVEGQQFEKPLLIGLTSLRGQSEFQLFNSDGRLVKKFTPKYKKYKPYRFDIVNWPNPKKPSILIGAVGFDKMKLIAMDLNGGSVFEYTMKDFPFNHPPQGITVKLSKSQEPYLVVSARSKSTSRLTQLAIFSPSGELIYQEIIKGWTPMAANSCKSNQDEVLLVRRDGKTIWEYSLKPGNP